MSYAQERTREASLMKLAICNLLDWTELEYGEFQFKSGCSYLQHYIPNDPHGIDELLKHRMFWNWWRNQWHNRDFAFMLDSNNELSKLCLSNKRLLYMHYHDARMLAAEIAPNAIIIADAYKKMIGELIKEEVK
jgi:hypothetical protein